MLPPIKYAHKSCPLPCDLHIQLDYNGSQLQNKKSIKKKKSVKRKKIVKRKKSVNRKKSIVEEIGSARVVEGCRIKKVR